MIKRLVVVIPGIHTSKAEAKGWAQALADCLSQEQEGVQGAVYWYGWLGAWAIRFPFIGGAVRRHHVARFQRYLARLRRANPLAEVDTACHSFGTWIAWEAMRQDGQPKAFYRRLCLMAAIVSSREDFKTVAGHFGGCLNLWSPEDAVVEFSTFGQAGWKGFVNAAGAVRNDEMRGYTHGSYESPGAAWDAAAAFLGAA